jgi:hypothetical protein
LIARRSLTVLSRCEVASCSSIGEADRAFIQRKEDITIGRPPVVVFENKTKGYGGKRALIQLDSEYSIGVHGYAVVAKKANGTSTIKQGDDVGPLGVWSTRQACREGNKYG